MRVGLVVFFCFYLISCGRNQEGSDSYALQDGDTFTEAPFHCTEDDLCFQDIDGEAVIEGDIIIGKTEDILERSSTRSATALTSKTTLWPRAIVPYTFRSDYPETKKKWVLDAAAHYAAVSHIRVIPRTTEIDYVEFVPTSGGSCSSMLGRRGGRQSINVGSCGGAGGIVHEIGHALGLYHEQSRPDRDQFVIIHFQNMSTGIASQFRVPTRNITTTGTYDFRSVMHYSPYSGSINGKPTITKLDGTTTGIGSQGKLTSLDLEGLAKLYPNGAIPLPSPTSSPTPTSSPKPPTPSPTKTPVPTPPAPSPSPGGDITAPSQLKHSFTFLVSFFEFQDNSLNETAFEIEIQEGDSGNWKSGGIIPSTPSNLLGLRTFFLVLNSKVNNTIRIRATNGSKYSGYSNTVLVGK